MLCSVCDRFPQARPCSSPQLFLRFRSRQAVSACRLEDTVSASVPTFVAVQPLGPSNRPLPREMLYYARSDTHFLLFVFDNLRNLLLNRSDSLESVQKVLDASSRTSLQVYNREMYDVEEGSGANGWAAFLTKFGNHGTAEFEIDRRKALVVAVHGWRDRVARELDESPPYVFFHASLDNNCHILACRYVLPSNVIFRLANAPSPPKDLPSLFKIASLPTIRDRAQELLDVLTTATLPASLVAANPRALRSQATGGAPQSSHVPNVCPPSKEPSPAPLVSDLWSASWASGTCYTNRYPPRPSLADLHDPPNPWDRQEGDKLPFGPRLCPRSPPHPALCLGRRTPCQQLP